MPLKPKANGMAIASLVFGIVWLGGIGSVLAVVFGFLGKKRIDDSNGQETGRGLAIAGIILGFLGIAGGVLTLALVVAVGHAVNQFSSSYDDGHNYGTSHYSANGDSTTVCNNAPVPGGDNSAEFNLGCLAGWASVSGNSIGSGNSGTSSNSGSSGNSGSSSTSSTSTPSGNSGSSSNSGNTGNSG
jgi:hypothetical protein